MRALLVLVILAFAAPTAHAENGDPWDGSTIALEVGGGAAGGLVLGAGLGLAGAGVGAIIDNRNWGVPLAGAFVGGVTGAFAGTIIRIHLVGDARGLDGRPWATMLGAGVGAAGAVAFGFYAADGGGSWALEVAIGYAIFLTPTIIGYSLGAEAEDGATARAISLPMLGGSF